MLDSSHTWPGLALSVSSNGGQTGSSDFTCKHRHLIFVHVIKAMLPCLGYYEVVT